MPVLQSTNRVKLSKVHETTFSETPVNPVFKAVRETSSSLAANPKTVVSSEIRPDRQVTDLVLVDEDADGDVAGEIAFGVADDDFEEALQGTWANNPAIVVMTSDTEISDVSATTLTVAAGGAVFGNTCRNANLRIHTSTLSLATSMPTTTRSICAIIHSLPCSVRAQRPLQLFGLRKTPVLSLALKQALSLLGAGGLSSSDGRLVGTARSHILADFLDTRAQSGRIVAAREPHHVFVLRLGIRPRRVSGETVEEPGSGSLASGCATIERPWINDGPEDHFNADDERSRKRHDGSQGVPRQMIAPFLPEILKSVPMRRAPETLG